MRAPWQALEIALRMKPGTGRKNILWFAPHMMTEDRPRLLKWCADHLQNEERIEATSTAFRSWSQRDPEAAVHWYLNHPEATVKPESLGQTTGLSDEAFGKLRGRIPTEEQGDWDFKVVCSMTGPQAAAYIARLPPDERREQHCFTTASHWATRQPEEASQWVNSLPVGPDRDQAIRGLVNGIRDTDPTSAFLWAGSIGDEKLRARSVSATWWEWRTDDAVAAWRWLRKAEISPGIRAVIDSMNLNLRR